MDIEINLHKSEMMYDVQNDTHIISQAKAGQGATPEAAYGLQADGEESHASKLLRSMQTAIESAKHRILHFLKDTADVEANNIIMDSDTDLITITLSVSDRFNKAFVPTIAGMMHRYVVNMMLFDWFNSSEQSLAEKYRVIAEEAAIGMQRSFTKLPPTKPIH
jgi:hypothetical protein